MDSGGSSSERSSDMVVNRPDRIGLAEAIRQFLNDEIKAFAFDDAAFVYRNSSDPTVRYVAKELWYFHDDLKNHPVRICKAGWDYLQRLLLVLESESFIYQEKVSLHSRTQLSAVVALACGLLLLLGTLESWSYAAIFATGGAIAVSNHRVRKRERTELMNLNRLQSQSPFNGTFEIAKTLNSAKGFRKQQYRPELAHRRIRSWDLIVHFPGETELVVFFFWPIVILFQLFPIIARRTHVQSSP